MKISRFNLFRWLSIGLIVFSAVLLVLQLIEYSRLRAGFPSGTKIAGIAVGGLDQEAAAERVEQAYSTSIELIYKDQFFQVKPSQIGFEINMESMIAAADQQRVQQPFWLGFWDYLWNRTPDAGDTPLVSNVDENRLRVYLMDEVASRYDQVPETSIPLAGTVNFQYGKPGYELDVDKSIPIVERALQSATDRTASLIVNEVAPSRPSLNNLEILIKQMLDKANFEGLTEIYILDLENRQELNFAYNNGKDIEPGIAFSAWSTIKIPIMVSIFKALDEPTPTYAQSLMEQMIEISGDTPADTLMQTYLDPNVGPIIMTKDMEDLGLENTFMAGYFYNGAPLLQRYVTPANSRQDIDTGPDAYNQTTTADLGMILDDIYQCAKDGGGTFAAVFPGKISQSECQQMITYLSQNKIGQLLDSTLPDGTKIAHKHGWVAETDGVIHTMLDAGIIYAPSGDYIEVVAMYHPTQLVFDVGNYLFGQISRATYNYFDIQQQ